MADFGAQNSTKALDILTFGAIATYNNCHTTVWNIHTFVEHATCNQFGVLTGAETFKNDASFFSGSFIGDTGQAETTTDLINYLVILREENYLISGMHAQ